MYPFPDVLEPIVDADLLVESIQENVAGLYFRSLLIKKEGVIVPQHVHDGYDHATYVGAGSCRLWVDKVWAGDYEEGVAIKIEAGRQHSFMALVSMTRLCCVHDIMSAESITRKGV